MIHTRRLSYSLKIGQLMKILFRIHTEIWDENFSNGEVSDHHLEDNGYVYQVALFLVEPNFCNANIFQHYP